MKFKTICKEDYFREINNNRIKIFEEGKEYTCNDTGNETFITTANNKKYFSKNYLFNISDNPMLEYDIKLYDNNCPIDYLRFKSYFYTQSEMRNLKLKKLNEI